MLTDPKILAVIDEIDEYRKSKEDSWQIPRIEGELLHHIALAAGAKVIVEVGSSYGFSGLFWGAAMLRTGGKLHTIDISEKKFDASKAAFAKAGCLFEGVGELENAEVLAVAADDLEADGEAFGGEACGHRCSGIAGFSGPGAV